MEFDETSRFWYSHVALDAWMNFASCFDEILRSDFCISEKEAKRRKKKNKKPFLSLHANSPGRPPPFAFPFFDFYVVVFSLFFLFFFFPIISST